jgi:hypothetical protein
MPNCKITKKTVLSSPYKNAQVEPWNRVDVDLIGPWTVKTQSGPKSMKFLTIIDPDTYWFEIIPIRNPTAAEVMEAFTNEWLSQYPRSQYIGFDNGSEFKSVFIQTSINYGIKSKPSKSHNPQSNRVIERVHLTLGNMLRSFEMQNKTLNEEDPWSSFLEVTAWAIRSTYHTTLHATPTQLVFGRDMILNIKFKADWVIIDAQKQSRTEKDDCNKNSKRIPP